MKSKPIPLNPDKFSSYRDYVWYRDIRRHPDCLSYADIQRTATAFDIATFMEQDLGWPYHPRAAVRGLALLRCMGVEKVEVEFSGGGDEGQIDSTYIAANGCDIEYRMYQRYYIVNEWAAPAEYVFSCLGLPERILRELFDTGDLRIGGFWKDPTGDHWPAPFELVEAIANDFIDETYGGFNGDIYVSGAVTLRPQKCEAEISCLEEDQSTFTDGAVEYIDEQAEQEGIEPGSEDYWSFAREVASTIDNAYPSDDNCGSMLKVEDERWIREVTDDYMKTRNFTPTRDLKGAE